MLDDKQKKKGVIAASAGNHAQVREEEGEEEKEGEEKEEKEKEEEGKKVEE